MSEKSRKTHIVAPPDCTGCSLCANVCGHDAITMVWSEEGFLIPRVNEDACINCGVCVKKCPALQPAPAYRDDLKDTVPAYGAWHRDREVHRTSSSGGIFTALAEWTIGQGGCVFGVVWKDKETAVFAKAETMEEVAPMRGSKYIMAVVGSAFREVKAELRKGRRVLFVGTPCQVNALKAYLVKRYDALLVTVDIVCHGIPSRLMWEQYISEIEERTGKTVDHVLCRDKVTSWKEYNLTVYFRDNSSETCMYWNNAYMRLFISGVAMNLCCYRCRYAALPRQGDLTLGDFWGVHQYHPSWPLREGITAMMINTPTGEHARLGILEKLNCQNVPFSEVCSGQDLLHDKGDQRVHPYRGAVISLLKRMPLDTIFSRVENVVQVAGFNFHVDTILGRFVLGMRRVFRFFLKK